jgi:hypothetical protein
MKTLHRVREENERAEKIAHHAPEEALPTATVPQSFFERSKSIRSIEASSWSYLMAPEEKARMVEPGGSPGGTTGELRERIATWEAMDEETLRLNNKEYGLSEKGDLEDGL